MRDVIIIGAGGGGPIVAKELAARGLDVLVLEGGAAFKNSETEFTHYENDANNPVTGFLRMGPQNRDLGPWLPDLVQQSFLWHVSGVGGTTLHYFGNNPRAMPGVFQGYAGADAANYDVNHLFPFTYESLIPYYEWVETTLPVQTAAMGTKEQIFLEAAAAMGLPHQTTKDTHGPGHRAQENAILQPQGTAGHTSDPALLVYPQAQGCTFCGHCYQGCIEPLRSPRNLRAKRSTDNSYVPMMLTADAWASGGNPAELRASTYVTKILTELRNGVPTAIGVEFRDATGVHQETATVVCLAGGASESPRLWLSSGLPNPNGWVGRGLTDHHMDWVVGVFDKYTGATFGAGSSARADWPGYGGVENICLPPALQSYALTYSDAGVSGRYDNNTPNDPAGADTFGRLIGNDLVESLSDTNRLLTALIITDDDVEYQNRVELSPIVPPTEHGPRPKVVVNHRGRSARTQRNRRFLAQRAVELMRAAGARHVHRSDWPPLILHSHSSMRMGSDPTTSVVDDSCEARAVKNLFVTDNSSLANSIGGPNPTLTTQAIATRASEKIFQRYFGGDAWVGSEAPVSSIDDRVTQAVISRGLFD